MYDKIPVMVLMIFEHGVNMRVRIINLEISDWRVDEMTDRFLEASNVFSLYDKNGWIKTPNENECDKCLLNCDKRMVKSSIYFENQRY